MEKRMREERNERWRRGMKGGRRGEEGGERGRIRGGEGMERVRGARMREIERGGD